MNQLFSAVLFEVFFLMNIDPNEKNEQFFARFPALDENVELNPEIRELIK